MNPILARAVFVEKKGAGPRG